MVSASFSADGTLGATESDSAHAELSSFSHCAVDHFGEQSAITWVGRRQEQRNLCRECDQVDPSLISAH
jgi:hypothetical protein